MDPVTRLIPEVESGVSPFYINIPRYWKYNAGRISSSNFQEETLQMLCYRPDWEWRAELQPGSRDSSAATSLPPSRSEVIQSLPFCSWETI